MKKNGLAVYGLAYKDIEADASATLKELGDPYIITATDADGKIGIDYGVYGVPETYIIDKMGIIRYKQIGPITPESLRDKILPMLETLSK